MPPSVPVLPSLPDNAQLVTLDARAVSKLNRGRNRLKAAQEEIERARLHVQQAEDGLKNVSGRLEQIVEDVLEEVGVKLSQAILRYEDVKDEWTLHKLVDEAAPAEPPIEPGAPANPEQPAYVCDVCGAQGTDRLSTVCDATLHSLAGKG